MMFETCPVDHKFLQFSEAGAASLIGLVLSDELSYEDRSGLLWTALMGMVMPRELGPIQTALLLNTIRNGFGDTQDTITDVLGKTIPADAEAMLNDLTNGQ